MTRQSSFGLVWWIAGTLATGCALPGITADYDAGANGVGGSKGGASATGGSRPNAGASNGGGGAANVGGKSSGGTSSSAGSSQLGGSTSSGGSPAVGGSSTQGGSAATGGAAGGAGATGGVIVSVGGQTTGTGGTKTIGGQSSTGGATAAGGTSSAGGSRPTGGASSTGGSKPTGGAPSTGGAAGTGGSSSTKLVATAVAAGYGHACALIQDGTIWCWGNNTDGELGNGASVDGTEIISKVPVMVLNVSQAVSIATGYYHTCAVLSSGIIQCWGWNGEGELGNGKSGSSSRYSVPANVKIDGVNDLTNGAAVVAGEMSTCALLTDGTVNCWGDNSYNQLGRGNTNSSTIPVTVVGPGTPPSPLAQVTKLALQSDHVCAIQTGGAVFCWGEDDYGQLGNRSTTSPTTAVQAIGIQATAVGVGEYHSCVIGSTGKVQCWGRDSYYGELGDNGTNDSLTPVTAETSALASTIAVGTSHSCVVLNDGTGKIECWGANSYGQLGNGSTSDSGVPVGVSYLTQAKTLACGDDFSCAVIAGGSVYCWGDNWYGSLGDGTGGHNTESSTPTLVSGF